MTTPDHLPLHLHLPQRIDLALANRIADEVPSEVDELALGRSGPDLPEAPEPRWIAGVLALRGLVVSESEVHAVLHGGKSRFDPRHYEHKMIHGMQRVYRTIRDGESRPAPDGWAVVGLFKDLTAGVARFRNNCLRRDTPWDAILFVEYPASEKVSGCLDGFHPANSFTDLRERFATLHPVRQSFRILWLFARIAPFPDFNLTMAWVVMNLHLLASGYPMLAPEPGDRERLHRLVAGPVPLKCIALETRMLESLSGD